MQYNEMKVKKMVIKRLIKQIILKNIEFIIVINIDGYNDGWLRISLP